MTSGKKILAICGSTRKDSSNHRLIRAIADLVADTMQLTLYDGLTDLPHFNPDQGDDHEPRAVHAFRQAIRDADGLLICTPEYAHGVPGSLKNAIDWTISTGDFSHKPTVLITASTDGRLGHAALLETLKVIEAENIDGLQLLVPFIRTKVGEDDTITDAATLTAVKQLMQDFLATMNEQARGMP